MYSKTRHPPKTEAIIVAPPWPNTGSSNIFSAQAAAHKKFGHEILLVLGSIHVYPRNYQEIKELKTEIKYDGVSRVVYGATYDSKRPYLSKSFLDWILAGVTILLPSMPDMLLVVDGEPAFWILSTAIRSMSSM